MVETTRAITATAQTTTRKARRDAERQRQRGTSTPAGSPRTTAPVIPDCPDDTAAGDDVAAQPFTVIEQW